jgi:hypothetical protein
VRVDSRAVLGATVVAAGMIALSRRGRSRLTSIVTAPLRWLEIVKGPSHSPPL